jgi:hypothetical protein
MAPLRTAFLLLAASSATVFAEHLRAVWSAGDFSTVSGPQGGNTNGHSSGFAIFNDNNEHIYNMAYPDDHAPCYTGDGREMTIEGNCWKTPRVFKCKSDFGGHPETCEVKDGDGNSLGTGEGQTNTEFIGIAISQDGGCVVEFESDSDGCKVDNGDGELFVTSG